MSNLRTIEGIVVRVMDCIISASLLALLSPLLLILVILGWWNLGSAIFTQTRVGFQGRNFRIYKFRSMPVATKDLPTHEVSSTNITPYGHFIRHTKLDELPQLWCVLIGDMSLVGPRPGLPSQEQLFLARQQRGVYRVRPGITGLGQIAEVDMSTPVKLARVDAIMTRRWSICLYIYILCVTLTGRGIGDRVPN